MFTKTYDCRDISILDKCEAALFLLSLYDLITYEEKTNIRKRMERYMKDQNET